MTRPRVSVALCTHNGARFLDAQLHSLIAQTQPPDEVVIHDDASTDDTFEVLQQFRREAPFPVHLHRNTTAAGVTENFSQTFQACSGDILMPCDQDDVWYPEKIAAQVQAFRDGVNLVFSDLQLVDAAGRPTGRTQWRELGFDEQLQAHFRADHPLRVLLRFNVVSGTAMAFSATLKPMVLPIPRSYVHDEWIALVAAATGRLRMVERPLVQYRQHDAQQIGAARRNMLSQLAHAQKHMDAAYFHALVERSQTLLARLEALAQQQPLTTDVLVAVRARLQHHMRRAELRDHKRRRIPTVLREWTTGHYQRFGYGWKSIAQDLLL